MQYIEHIIEPTELLLVWQSLDETHRTRYKVAKLEQTETGITLTYLVDTKDFRSAQEKGFESYPAFQDITRPHYNVLNTFMRRLPPRSRADFAQYLAGMRLKPDSVLSDFALLGYSGAKLLSDGFSLIHPFNNVDNECELLLEIVDFRHIEETDRKKVIAGTPVSFFVVDKHEITNEPAIRIMMDDKQLGYVNRALISTVLEWINDKRILNARIEKINGTPSRPAAYIYTQILEKELYSFCSQSPSL